MGPIIPGLPEGRKNETDRRESRRSAEKQGCLWFALPFLLQALQQTERTGVLPGRRSGVAVEQIDRPLIVLVPAGIHLLLGLGQGIPDAQQERPQILQPLALLAVVAHGGQPGADLGQGGAVLFVQAVQQAVGAVPALLQLMQ